MKSRDKRSPAYQFTLLMKNGEFETKLDQMLYDNISYGVKRINKGLVPETVLFGENAQWYGRPTKLDGTPVPGKFVVRKRYRGPRRKGPYHARYLGRSMCLKKDATSCDVYVYFERDWNILYKEILAEYKEKREK